ncbi:MAG: hypothetical protein U9Q83_00660 [Bacteroidota bacterium]|nr:hypothetical protein [Bacteroidota bacterium]
MKFEIKFTELEQATEFATNLKDKNLRGVKVSQAEKAPEEGSLDVAEFMPLIMLAVKSGLATAVVTQVFGLLKGFFVENKKTNSNERIEMAKLTTENKKVEFNIECNGKKLNFKLSKGSEEEMKGIIETIAAFEKEC